MRLARGVPGAGRYFGRIVPKLCHESEVLAGTLHFGSVLCAAGSMGYKHEELDPGPVLRELACPNFLIKIIPHVDGRPRVCELVRYRWQNVRLKGTWCGPGALQLFANALGNVAKRPVPNVLSGTHFVADVTLDLGEVVHDYFARGPRGAGVGPLSRGRASAMNEMRAPQAPVRRNNNSVDRTTPRQRHEIERESFFSASHHESRTKIDNDGLACAWRWKDGLQDVKFYKV